MQGLWVLCLGVLLSVPSQASEFKRFKELKKEVKAQWQKQSAATIPFHTAAGRRCTAVLVGPNGEALTNLHCVEQCLMNAQAAEPQNVAGTPLTKMVVQQTKLPVLCEGSIDTEKPFVNRAIQVMHVFGTGWISDREAFNVFLNESPEQYLELANQGIEGFGDLVLIKIPDAQKPCVSIGEADFSSTTVQLTGISFPIVWRKIGDNPFISQTFLTMGTTQLWSQGPATSQEDLLRQVVIPDLVESVDLITPAHLIVSSTDSEEGASGSPLFDESGQLVAVTRSTWKGATLDYVPWTSGAIDLQVHKSKIRSLIKDIDQCKD